MSFAGFNSSKFVKGRLQAALYFMRKKNRFERQLTVPGQPLEATAVAGDTEVTISFAPPVNNGGSAITRYTVTSSPGNITGTGTASPIVVEGLTNDVEYTFTVTATNAIGTGPASASSNAVTPTGA